MTFRIDFKVLAAVCFVMLVVVYARLGWNARERILQGNSDFIIYYTAIQMVRVGQGDQIYDLEAAAAIQQKILDTLQASLELNDPFRAGLLFFVNPPIALVWFLPLTTLSYLQALLVWDVFSLACLLAGIAILLRSHPMPSTSEASFLALACLAFPPVFVTLLQGQVSLLLFFFATLVYHSLKRKKEVQAGLWLSLLLTKFQLLLPFVAVFLWKRQWKALGGFLMGSLLALLISLSLVGVAGVKGYVQLAIEVAGWVNTKGMTPASMHCLRGQFNAWWYDSHPLLAMIVTIGCSFVLLALLIRTWQINWHEGFDLRFSLLVIVSVLVSPHLYFHDLSLLLVPGLLVYRFAIRNQEAEMKIRSLPVFLFITGYLLLWLSLIVSNLIPLQPSVWALIAWSVLLAGIAHRSRGSLAEVNALTATPRSRATGDTAFDR